METADHVENVGGIRCFRTIREGSVSMRANDSYGV